VDCQDGIIAVVITICGIRNLFDSIAQKRLTKKWLLPFVASLLLALPLFGAAASVNFDAVSSLFAQGQDVSDSNAQITITPSSEENIAFLEATGRRVVQVSSGTMHTLALRDDGSLWAWGRNDVGQLGLGNTTDHTTPQRITGGASEWKTISAGGCPDAVSSYSFAIDTDGNLWAWGRGREGQLGTGVTTNQTSPQRVTGGASEWKSISAGWLFTLGIGTDGSLWAWGRNNYGQLAQGEFSTTNRTTPIQVTSGPSTWQMVDAARYHGLGICADGHLWTWGGNHVGQIGLGLAPSEAFANARNIPTRVNSGATSWKYVSAGANYSAGIGTDGSLWTWGAGGQGRLGLGANVSNRNAPQRVTGGASEWETVSAGAYHCLAIDTDGSLWAWGRGDQGQIGDGNTVNRNTPQRIAVSTTGWQLTTVSVFQSLAIDGEGNLWSWGWNENGKLGKGITTPFDQHGTGTDNRIPWRVAASVIPASTTDWTAHNDATIPRNGGVGITDVNTENIVIHFDRPMCTEAASLGRIEVSHGAFVDMSNITDANWSNSTRGPNTVFSAPLTLFVSNTLHTARVSGFLDAQFGRRTINEMYPHEWNFRTEVVVPPLAVIDITPKGFDVSVTTENLIITFDQAVNTALPGNVTLNGDMLDLSTASWNENNSVLSIPLSPLDASGDIPNDNTLNFATVYTVIVADFISSGNKAMLGPHQHQFVTEADKVDTTIIKTLLLPENTPTPRVDFIFDIVAHSFNEDVERRHLLPPLAAQTITFTEAHASTGTTNTREVVLSSDYLLDGITFPQQGLYIYRVSERNNTFVNTATETMTFDTRIFEIGFLVQRLPEPATGLYVSAFYVQEVLEGEELAPKTEEPLGFTNSYVRRHENPDPTDPHQVGLRISKETAGAFANLHKYFDFHINIYAPDLIVEPSTYRAYVVERSTNTVVTSAENGTIAGTSTAGPYLRFTSGGQQNVALRHGQILVFVDTHVGTRYSAEEQPAQGHTPSLVLITDDRAQEVQNPEPGTSNVALGTGRQTLGVGANTADFTNTHISVTPTGFTLVNHPVVILSAALLLVTALLALRARRRIENLLCARV